MTRKQSARPDQERGNRDCFVVLPTPHRHPALLAMTWSGLFQQSFALGRERVDGDELMDSGNSSLVRGLFGSRLLADE